MNKIDLLEFIPEKVKCGKELKEYPLNLKIEEDYLMISYVTDTANQTEKIAKREYSLTTSRYIDPNLETFEVLGLLQAEMGKTDNGCISFCNHEYRLINKVIRWFGKELEIMPNQWRWYVKININEPEDEVYRKDIESKVIRHWLNKTKIDIDKKHPKTVSYIKNTKNKNLRFYDYGTLIIEYKSNLLSQIIKKYVKLMSHKIPSLEKEKIRGFMKGILAGESCVEVSKSSKKYRVHISATKQEERELYQKCLTRLGIYSKQYPRDKLVITKRENNIELLKQKLMCLSHEKYSKFLNMIKLYPEISEETRYFTGKREPHNKIPKEKINKILELCEKNPNWPCWKIAKEIGVSTIKVTRVRKEHNLGKRLTKTSKEIVEKVIELHNKNPSAYAYEIADQLGLHKSRVERIRRKYSLKRRCYSLSRAS